MILNYSIMLSQASVKMVGAADIASTRKAGRLNTVNQIIVRHCKMKCIFAQL
jgi:hypothetical protein